MYNEIRNSQRKECKTRVNQYVAKREIIEEFLKDLKSLLDSPDFDIETKFILTRNRSDGKNGATLVALDFDKSDVANELKKLTISNYYQSVPDDKNPSMPDLHVFYIFVLEREIYVKIRIQYVDNVLCVSFHFPLYSHGEMPYKNVLGV